MTRICFLTHSAAPAGAELSLLFELISRPSDGGIEIVVVFAQDGEMPDRFVRAGIPTQVVAMNPRFARSHGSSSHHKSPAGSIVGLLDVALRLRRRLRHEQFDVIVGRSLKAVLYGRLSTLGLRTRFVWCLHDRVTSQYLGRTAPLWSWVMPRFVNGIVVNSKSTLSTVRTGRKPVLILPPVVAPSLETLRRPTGGLRLLSLSRLAPWKGQDLLIRAFAAVYKGRDASLTIAGAALFGEDAYAKSLLELSDRLGLGAQIEFVGHVHDPRTLLATHDVLVSASSIPEPFGMVVLEGMSAGCVVVATRPGGPCELIADGDTGLLARAGELSDLQVVLRRVAAMTSSERAAMGARARCRARQYDPSSIAGEHLRWLVSISHRRATRLTSAGPVTVANVDPDLESKGGWHD